MINIFDVKPHEVSRDLRGYTVVLYGAPKTGKTTTAAKFPKPLLLAFEAGYADKALQSRACTFVPVAVLGGFSQGAEWMERETDHYGACSP